MNHLEKINFVKEKYHLGLSDKEIASLLGYKSSTPITKIRNYLNLPSRRDYCKELRNKIFKLVNEGYNDKQIGEILNETQKTIFYHRTKSKIKAAQYINIYSNQNDRIKGYMIRNSKFSAKRRNLEFNLTFEDFELPLLCPLLNIPLTYSNESSGNDYSHASLDRIDNNKGYIKGNVIVISKLANAMKNCASFEQLIIFSKNINILINYYKNQGALGDITDVFPNLKLRKVNLDL